MNVYSELWAMLNREKPADPAGLFGTLTAISPVTVTVRGTGRLPRGCFSPPALGSHGRTSAGTVALLVCEEGFWFLGFAGGGT